MATKKKATETPETTEALAEEAAAPKKASKAKAKAKAKSPAKKRAAAKRKTPAKKKAAGTEEPKSKAKKTRKRATSKKKAKEPEPVVEPEESQDEAEDEGIESLDGPGAEDLDTAADVMADAGGGNDDDPVEHIVPHDAIVVGGETDAYCTKCKRITLHTIISLLRSKPARVLCRSCGAQHRFRKDAKAAKKDRGRGVAKNRSLWEEALDRAGNEPIPYSAQTTFEIDQALYHKVFGRGVVVRVYETTKMEVLFEDKVRRLVHGR